MKIRWFLSSLILLLLSATACAEEKPCAETAIVVLGTRPLDEKTPSLDMVRRVERGLELHAQYPAAAVIFTGGRTAGPVSEAEMMERLARARGLKKRADILEEASQSTEENARYTAAKVRPCVYERTLLVTRPNHMKRAAAIFSRYKEFGAIEPEASRITTPEIVQNLRDHLSRKPSSSVKGILEKVQKEDAAKS